MVAGTTSLSMALFLFYNQNTPRRVTDSYKVKKGRIHIFGASGQRWHNCRQLHRSLGNGIVILQDFGHSDNDSTSVSRGLTIVRSALITSKRKL